MSHLLLSSKLSPMRLKVFSEKEVRFSRQKG